MRIRFLQYRNSLKRGLVEKALVFKKKVKKWWGRIREKGHEKMTIMFIPHNEKRIFNFQISRFTLFFFFFLFLIILATSAYALIRNSSLKRDEYKLLIAFREIRDQLVNFEKHTDSISDTMEDIKPEIEKLYRLSSGTKNSEHLWELADFDPEGLKDLKEKKHIYPQEIFTIKDIQKDLICTTNTVRAVKTFLKERSKVFNMTPSVIPTHGNITSLFGWRRSPWGPRVEYHSGIDIATSEGTPIIATAQGKVVSAGWGGGYGMMLRIEHEYGFESVYGHCSSIRVGLGQHVSRGQVVATVGQTGNATGAHCHYEVRIGGTAVNPIPYMSEAW